MCILVTSQKNLQDLFEQEVCFFSGEVMYVFINPSAWAECDTKAIFFKRSLTGSNLEFSFS